MGQIAQEELDRIESIKQSTLEVASILGELSYQKIVIDDQIYQQKEKVLLLKKQESVLFEELKSKYGNVTINIETGEFK
jgi:hypothetical protein